MTDDRFSRYNLLRMKLPAPSPMVQIPLKEYDKLKEQQHYITDKSLIDIIDNMERLLRALRKHIVRTDI